MSIQGFVSEIGYLHSTDDVFTILCGLVESHPTSSGLGVLLVAEVEVGPDTFEVILVGNVLEY